MNNGRNILTDLFESDGDTGVAVPTTDCFNVSSAVRWYVAPPSWSWTWWVYFVHRGFFTSLWRRNVTIYNIYKYLICTEYHFQYTLYMQQALLTTECNVYLIKSFRNEEFMDNSFLSVYRLYNSERCSLVSGYWVIFHARSVLVWETIKRRKIEGLLAV